MSGICVYAEQFDGQIRPYTAQLITAARGLSGKEPVRVLLLGSDISALLDQLTYPNISVTAVETALSPFQDDALSVLAAQALTRLDPDIVLIPATRTARALFSRVGAAMDCGLTADCLRMYYDRNQRFLQEKYAFGDNALAIATETGRPKLITVQPDGYEACPTCGYRPAVDALRFPPVCSRVEILESKARGEEALFASAKRVVSLGRGAANASSLAKAEEFAERWGAAVGGTRPLVDSGRIPFQRQIGQTGCTIYPEICLFLGVSGAIQHTEGVKGAKLTIAVNHDPHAAIFQFADFGAVADVEEILDALLTLGPSEKKI